MQEEGQQCVRQVEQLQKEMAANEEHHQAVVSGLRTTGHGAMTTLQDEATRLTLLCGNLTNQHTTDTTTITNMRAEAAAALDAAATAFTRAEKQVAA